MRNCIDIMGEIASLFSDADFFVCNDDRTIYPDGSRDSINCVESNDIFFIRDIDTQDMECDVHFHKCGTSDKVKNRNVCCDNARWYIISDETGYWEDVRYPKYCYRGKYHNYSNRCESEYMENPGCFYPFSHNKGNNCHR